ncbi:unnamed protein product [Schistosoma margrebowiei]|uniref:Uncharacterized protein n=1 Tax=Schistosoma margrebowiei TaxID=48269 RepID=A0A183N8B6_9TREM|nr:unnamed protein product [Schistosoma margrebowiei]
MRFSPSRCKLLLQDWSALTPELRIGSEVVERVDNFTYLGSLISPNGLVSDEISARIRKAPLAFANLRHLWRRRDTHLSIKGRVYCAAVRSVLIYGSETWPLRVENTRKLLVFDHRCLRNIEISVSTKGRVYCAAVRSVLLYGSETWPVRAEDIRPLLVYDHRCLRKIARISWDHRVSNAVVRKRVLGEDGK